VPKADLYVDVVFGEARVGGEHESPIRFRLHIKRADVLVVVPESEPLRIDKRSVSRDTPKTKARSAKTVQHKSSATASASLKAAMKGTGIGGSVGLNAKAEANAATDQRLEISTDSGALTVIQSK